MEKFRATQWKMMMRNKLGNFKTIPNFSYRPTSLFLLTYNFPIPMDNETASYQCESLNRNRVKLHLFSLSLLFSCCVWIGTWDFQTWEYFFIHIINVFQSNVLIRCTEVTKPRSSFSRFEQLINEVMHGFDCYLLADYCPDPINRLSPILKLLLIQLVWIR